MIHRRNFGTIAVQERRDKVMAHLRILGEPRSAKAISEALNLEKQLVNNDLMRLLDFGEVVKDSGGWWSSPRSKP